MFHFTFSSKIFGCITIDGKNEEIIQTEKWVSFDDEKPENEREQKIERWDQVAHGTHKYWWTIA